MFKVSNSNTRTKCEICPELTIKSNKVQINYFTPCSSVFTVKFEQVNTGLVVSTLNHIISILTLRDLPHEKKCVNLTCKAKIRSISVLTYENESFH